MTSFTAVGSQGADRTYSRGRQFWSSSHQQRDINQAGSWWSLRLPSNREWPMNWSRNFHIAKVRYCHGFLPFSEDFDHQPIICWTTVVSGTIWVSFVLHRRVTCIQKRLKQCICCNPVILNLYAMRKKLKGRRSCFFLIS